ncbi:MAG TPA: glycoside hydrolase/phage tail family protein, partial [Beijerinckiaceae bacterium]
RQPAYPWRGRITCDPAPGRPASPDGTAAAGAQVAAFFGSQEPGAGEWSYRRMILHYARLCAQAGGVDAFLIGSEFVGLTRVRSAPGVYPAVAQLAQLAADVKAILGPATRVSYAADWTEYGAHVRDGGAEVRFPLDPLWASPAVDFVGVDFWAPLSDWRDGAHLDAAEAESVYDLAYLRGRVAGGEAFDWFYADADARRAQVRTPIADGAYGKPWTFRAKDLAGWWSQPHVERVGGVELAQPTAWTPRGKPIWLTELGCPAVDRGANAPNVFPDPKSVESELPPFSRGHRDDLMQARAIEATLTRFDPASPGFVEDWNPVSPVYGGRMVDPARLYVWAWDARPFPAFPRQSEVWGDTAQWSVGHWLNGRLEGAPLDDLATARARLAPALETTPVAARTHGFVDGYVLDRPMSPRAALEPLAALFRFDGVASSGALRFETRAGAVVHALTLDDLAPRKDGARVALVRAPDGELPQAIAVAHWDGEGDYRVAAAQSRRLEGASRRETAAEAALVTSRSEAQRRAEIWLQDLWSAARPRPSTFGPACWRWRSATRCGCRRRPAAASIASSGSSTPACARSRRGPWTRRSSIFRPAPWPRRPRRRPRRRRRRRFASSISRRCAAIRRRCSTSPPSPSPGRARSPSGAARGTASTSCASSSARR